MSTYYLPFRGDVVDIASRGRRLLLAVRHPEGQPLSAFQINIEDLVVMGAQMDALEPAGPDADVNSVAVSGERTFYATSGGDLYLEQGKDLTQIATFTEAIVGLHPLAGDRLMVQLSDKVAIISQVDGAAQQHFDYDGDQITAVAVQGDGARFALGFAGGGILLFFEKNGAFQEGYLLDDDDEILQVAHERGVTALLFTEDEDGQMQLVSTGADLQMLQAPIEEGRPMPRATKEMHSQPVCAIVDGPHGRFHTIGLDKKVKTWTSTYSRRRPANWDISGVPQDGVFVELPSRDAQGRWSDQPHVVVAAGSGLLTLEIENLDAGSDAVDPDTLKNNGRIKAAGPEIQGGVAFMQALGSSKESRLRKQVLEIVGDWGDTKTVEFLADRANNDEVAEIRLAALERLLASSHPRTVVLLEGLLQSKYLETREKAYRSLREALGEESLRPMRLGLQNSETAVASRAASDLGGRARAGDVAALDLLKSTLSHKMYDVAAAAYDQLSGAGDISPALDGVEGVLIGIRSTQPEVRRRAVARLKERDLINTLPAQVVLRRMREDDDEAMRERAFYVSLLGQPRLAELMRSDDEELHKQLCDLEMPGASSEERIAAIQNQPTGHDVTLEFDDEALLHEMSASQSADIAALATVTHARLGDRGALPILLQLCREAVPRLRRIACRGLRYMLHDSLAVQELESLMLSDDDANVRLTAFDGVMIAALDKGEPLAPLRKALDSKHSDLRKTAVVYLQRYVNNLLEQDLELDYPSAKAPATQLSAEVELLQRALDDTTFDAQISNEAYKTFINRRLIGGTQANVMAHLVNSANRRVRVTAVKDILSFLEEPWAVDLIISSLDDNDHGFRHEIFDGAYSRVSGTPLESVLLEGALTGRHRDIRRKAFRKIIAATGAWQTPLLMSGLGDSDRDIREMAISAQAVERLKQSGKAVDHLTEAIRSRDSDIKRRALAILNSQPDLITPALYDELRSAIQGRDARLAKAAFGNGVRQWAKKAGREQELITDAFGSASVDIRRTVMGWLRGLDSDWAEDLLRQALKDRDSHIAQTAFDELLQRSQSRSEAASFLRDSFKNTSGALRNKVLSELRATEGTWVEELLREALVDSDDNVAQAAFNELLNRHRARGEEEQFISEAMKLNERLRRQAFGLVQSTSSSWKSKMLRDALSSEDDYIRAMAVEELITHELDDGFLSTLLNHKYEDVQAAAMSVLARKGRVDLIKSRLGRALRADKPSKWRWEDHSRYQKRYQRWKDTKVTALKVAGESQDESLFDDVMFVVAKSEAGGRRKSRGRRSSSSDANWNEPGIRRLAILQLGWICPEGKISQLKTLFSRERDRDSRYNAALALANTGEYEGAKWLYDQNAKSEHIIQSIIAVGGEAQSLLQRMMKEKPALADEGLFAWMLRLAAVGGSVEFLALGLTSNQSRTRLSAARLLAVCHDRDQLLDRLVELLSDRDPFADDPFAKSDIGADWYRVSKMLYEFYSRDYPTEMEIPRTDWRRLGLLFSHGESRVRARAVQLLYKLRQHGMKQHEFQTILRQRADNHLRTLGITPAPLTLNDEPLSTTLSTQLAMGAYTGLLRQPGNLTHRRQALKYLVDLALANDPRRAVPVLQASMSGRVAELRRDSFGHLTRLSLEAQRKLDPDSETAGTKGVDLPVLDLAEAAVHTEDNALQQLAISLLWLTGEEQRVESLLRTRDDGTALYAFLALYENREDKRLEVLPIALSSGNSQIRMDAVKKLVAELQRLRTEKLDDSEALALINETLRSPYPELVRRTAVLAAHAKEPAGKAYLEELLGSHIKADQKTAVQALVALGAPGTALLFMDRADADQTGSVDRDLLFKGVADLDDTSAPVLDRLFELVSQGPADPEYHHTIRALLAFSGHSSPVSASAVWAQLSEDDQKEQQEKYDDALLARLLDALYTHSHPETVTRYRLLQAAQTAWSSAVDPSVKLWALLPDTAQNSSLKLQAIQTAAWRYQNREQSTALEEALVGNLSVFGANKVISSYQYTAAQALGAAGFKGDGRVFTFLRRIAVNGTEYTHSWRQASVETLGKMADLRAVESLLNIAGYDEQGQPIPKETSGYQETQLELAALEALGQMSASPLAGAFFQALAAGSRKRDKRFVSAAVKGLSFFGNNTQYAGPALDLLLNVQVSRHYGMSREVISAIGELWRRSEDDAFKARTVDALIEYLKGSDRRDIEAAYDVLKEAASDDDLRPAEALYHNKVNTSATNDAVDKLAASSSAAELFKMLREGRETGYASDRMSRIARGIASMQPRPVAEALDALRLDLKRETSHTINDALSVLTSGAEDMDEAGRRYIVDSTRLLRESWEEARDLRDKGHADKAKRMAELEPIWEQLLGLCGVLQTGQDELAAALLAKGAPVSLQKNCLLALESFSSAPTEAISELFRAGQRQLRPLIAAALSDAGVRASLIDEASADAGSLHLLVGDGGDVTRAALRASAREGSALALSELSRLNDVAGLVALLEEATQGATESSPVKADHEHVVRVLRALGTTGDETAEAELAEVGQSATFDPALRRLAWNVRRRSQRIRARRAKHSAEISR